MSEDGFTVSRPDDPDWDVDPWSEVPDPPPRVIAPLRPPGSVIESPDGSTLRATHFYRPHGPLPVLHLGGCRSNEDIALLEELRAVGPDARQLGPPWRDPALVVLDVEPDSDRVVDVVELARFAAFLDQSHWVVAADDDDTRWIVTMVDAFQIESLALLPSVDDALAASSTAMRWPERAASTLLGRLSPGDDAGLAVLLDALLEEDHPAGPYLAGALQAGWQLESVQPVDAPLDRRRWPPPPSTWPGPGASITDLPVCPTSAPEPSTAARTLVLRFAGTSADRCVGVDLRLV